MKNRTITVTLSADRDTVFAFLADLENWPHWATGFCRGLQAEGAYWRGMSPAGYDYFALRGDARTGVIDLLIGAQPDEMALLPMRVVHRAHGAAVICTVFHPIDWPDELYERFYAALLCDLRGLIEHFQGGQIAGATAARQPFYPSVVTGKFYETWDFYTTQLGFRTLTESDAYVHLAHPCGAQLGVLREEVEAVRPELVCATNGRGYCFNFEVVDADAEYARLVSAGVEIVQAIADKSSGERQFVVRDPNGVLIAIAHAITPRVEEFAAAAVSD